MSDRTSRPQRDAFIKLRLAEGTHTSGQIGVSDWAAEIEADYVGWLGEQGVGAIAGAPGVRGSDHRRAGMLRSVMVLLSSKAIPTPSPGACTAMPTMATLTVELPEDLVETLGSPEALASQARQAFVLDLLREGQISQGVVARLLGITRYDVLDLMARYQIPSGLRTAEEMDRDLENARRYAQGMRVDGRDQRQ